VIIIELFSVFGRIGLDDSQFNQGINQAEGKGRGFGESFAKVAAGVVKAGAAITATGVAIGLAAMHWGGQMDARLRGIQAQTNFANDEIQMLKMGVRDLALETGRYTAQEMLTALEDMSIYGRDANEMLALLEYGMMLADSRGESLDDAMSLLSMSLDKAGKSVESGGRYMNVFAQLARETNLPLSTLQNNVVALAPTMNAWNIELEESAGWLARLKQEGIYGTRATSGLAYMFRDLATVTPETANELREMGVELFDMNGNMRDGYAVLNQLKDVMSGMTDKELAAFQQELWGANGTTRAVLKETSQGVRYHNKLFKAEAEARDLAIGYDRAIGYSLTTPTEALIEKLREAGFALDIPFARHTLGNGKAAQRNKAYKYECPSCGQNVRSTADLNIVCGECGVRMERGE